MSPAASGGEPRVRLEVDGGVAEVVLSAPPVNELRLETLAQLNQALDGIGDEVRAVAVISEVPRMFMAGGDIDFLRSAPMPEQGEYVRLVQSTLTRFERLRQPVVAGIDGPALGGGLELALCCDVRIVAVGAVLGLPEVRLGILPGAGGTQRLVRAIGQGVARDLLLTGRRVSGAEARVAGIASRTVADGEASEAARALARELAGGAREAIEAIKRLALAAQHNPIDVGLQQEWSEYMEVRRSANADEGLAAFAEKRPPSFS